MTNYFNEQYEAIQATIPDVPRDLPCYQINVPLWLFWRKVDPTATEQPIMTEQEITRRLDLLYMGDGTC
jgi:hypothetical protein